MAADSHLQNALPIIGEIITAEAQNVRGWKSVQLNPDEPDSSVFVRQLEDFVLDAMSSADIRYYKEEFSRCFSCAVVSVLQTS